MTTTTTSPVRSLNLAAAPDAAIPFSRLLRAEWDKASGTRAGRWLLVAVALGTAGLMLVPVLAASSVEQTWTSYLEWAAMGVTVLLPVVAILMLTGEWSQRTALTTFTQEPRRSRVFGAKVTVSLLLAGAGAAFAALVTAAALGLAQASGRELDANLTGGVMLGYLLYVLLSVLNGVAFGALVHNTAAAVVLYFALPTVLGAVGLAWTSMAKWIDPSASFTWMLRGEWSGHTGPIVVAATLWVAAPLAAGLVRTLRREVS